MDIQQTMFPDLAPEVDLIPRVEIAEPLVERTAEWVLVGRKNRHPMFHVVKSRTGGFYGLTTLCGVQGWEITDDEHQMIHTCRDCSARRVL